MPSLATDFVFCAATNRKKQPPTVPIRQHGCDGKRCVVARLGMDDLTASRSRFFERHRTDSQVLDRNRNCRCRRCTASIDSSADREPLAAAQCAAVLRITTKQAPVVEVRDLDEDEISAILAQPKPLELRASAITSYWRSYITPVHVFKSVGSSVQALRLESPFRFACSVKQKRANLPSLARDC